MIEPLDGHGLIYRPPTGPPDGATPRALLTYGRQVLAAAVTAAEDWLVDHGASPWDLAGLDLPANSRIAWWADGLGFVQEAHPGAVLVVVVDVPAADALPAPSGEPVEIPAPEPPPQERT